MAGFVPKEKMSKKARKELNRQRRKTDMLPFEDTEKEKLYLRRELFLCGRGTYPLKDLLKQ